MKRIEQILHRFSTGRVTLAALVVFVLIVLSP